mmetsp:Transcript_24905/g.53755  ORF Transcript_24905/g.53755 Transcript_24905/m.53755 type:complete len:251 (+) Transcript_24905:437-1189(+)
MRVREVVQKVRELLDPREEGRGEGPRLGSGGEQRQPAVLGGSGDEDVEDLVVEEHLVAEVGERRDEMRRLRLHAVEDQLVRDVPKVEPELLVGGVAADGLALGGERGDEIGLRALGWRLGCEMRGEREHRGVVLRRCLEEGGEVGVPEGLEGAVEGENVLLEDRGGVDGARGRVREGLRLLPAAGEAHEDLLVLVEVAGVVDCEVLLHVPRLGEEGRMLLDGAVVGRDSDGVELLGVGPLDGVPLDGMPL